MNNEQPQSNNIKINVKDSATTSVLMEVLKTQAMIRSLASLLLKEQDEINTFLEGVEEEFGILLKAFLQENPHLIKK